MPIVTTCPGCGQKARVPDDLLGQSAKCPTCAATFTVPAADPPEAPAVAEPARPPLPADPDALRAVRAAAGVQVLAHLCYAAALGGVVFVVVLSATGAVAGPGAAGGPAAWAGFAMFASGLSLAVGGVLSFVAAGLFVLAPPARLARGLAVAMLLLTLAAVERTAVVINWLAVYDQVGAQRWGGPGPLGGGLWVSGLFGLLLVWLFETARLCLLALVCRAVSLILRDGRGAATAYRLAIAGPTLQTVLFAGWLTFAFLANLDRELAILGLVGWMALQAVVLLWGAVVLIRLRRRLAAAVGPA